MAETKVHSYARDMNLNGKCEKKYVVLENKNCVFFSYQKCFIGLLAYLAGIMGLNAPSIILFSIEVT